MKAEMAKLLEWNLVELDLELKQIRLSFVLLRSNILA